MRRSPMLTNAQKGFVMGAKDVHKGAFWRAYNSEHMCCCQASASEATAPTTIASKAHDGCSGELGLPVLKRLPGADYREQSPAHPWLVQRIARRKQSVPNGTPKSVEGFSGICIATWMHLSALIKWSDLFERNLRPNLILIRVHVSRARIRFLFSACVAYLLAFQIGIGCDPHTNSKMPILIV